MEWFNAATDFAVEWWQMNLDRFWNTDELDALVLFLIIAVVLITYLKMGGSAGHRAKSKGTGRMRLRERLAIEDAITEGGIDKAVRDGKITAKRAKVWYGMLAQSHNLPGLVGRYRYFKPLHPHRIALLKIEIRQRLNSAFYKLKMKIPGPPPPQLEAAPVVGKGWSASAASGKNKVVHPRFAKALNTK